MLENVPGQKITDTTIVVFDLETTGFSPRYGDEIVEIGAIKARGREVLSEFQSMVNPLRPISAGASAVNGITNDMVKDAPVIEKVLPGFLEFIGDHPLVAHNASFDLSFVAWKIIEMKLPIPKNIVFDTMKLSRSIHPEFKSHKLVEIVNKLSIDVSPEHRAVSDAHATLEVFNSLLRSQKNSITLEGALRFQGGTSTWPVYMASEVLPGPLSEKETILQDAITNKQNLTIEYCSPYKDSSTTREIYPVKLIRRPGKTYVVADCLLRNEQRTFRVDRISSITNDVETIHE